MPIEALTKKMDEKVLDKPQGVKRDRHDFDFNLSENTEIIYIDSDSSVKEDNIVFLDSQPEASTCAAEVPSVNDEETNKRQKILEELTSVPEPVKIFHTEYKTRIMK